MQLYKLYEPYELYKLNRIFAYQSIETMKNYTRNIVIGLCVALAACSFSRGKKAEQGAARMQAFRLPEIPSIYTDEREQVKYLVARYWEHFDFADTSLIRRPEITEQAFANYLQLFPRVPYADVERDVESGGIDMKIFERDADSVMFAHFTSLYEKYLYDPNSPMLSEEFYIPVLRYIVASPRVGEVDKLRPAFRLEMALKNRPGSAATDFVYTLPSGKREKLSFLSHPSRLHDSILQQSRLRRLPGDQSGVRGRRFREFPVERETGGIAAAGISFRVPRPRR